MGTNYIAFGVATDCQRILQKLDVYERITLKAFTQVWKEMKFRHIFYGRRSFIDLFEFTEEVLNIAKDLWLAPNSFPRRVNRFYLMSTLYLEQMFTNPRLFIKIRVAQTEIEELNKFSNEAQTEGFPEVKKLLHFLYSNNAFSLSAKRRDYALEYDYRNYLQNDFDKSNVCREPSIDELFRESGMYDNLKSAFSEYHQLKCSMAPDGKLPESLNLINANSCDELLSINMSNTMSAESATTSCVESIEQRRKGIRDRSYRRRCDLKRKSGCGTKSDSDISEEENEQQRK